MKTVSDAIEIIDTAASIATVKTFLLQLQNEICLWLEQEDGHASFQEDLWQHSSGGGGRTRVLTSQVIEKAGVNFSHVTGFALPPAATAKRKELTDASFEALGISTVIHPYNPFVPTTHMNVRFIVVNKPNQPAVWWFGGGFDLTPYYGFEEDCIHWHKIARAACAPLGEAAYLHYKKWCDEYFFLKHRQEPRGIGGIFFDDVNHATFKTCFAFMQSVGQHFIKGYQPILARRKSHSFSQKERDFQAYRRGRYVEFNLLYDRGTLFGLQSGGRTESILMSLPPVVHWQYDWQPAPASLEEKLYTSFLIPKDWLATK